MLAGFVVSDKNRRSVFLELTSGETTLDRVQKRSRVVRPAVEKVLADFRARGLVAEKGGKLSLTPEGEKVWAEIQREGLLR